MHRHPSVAVAGSCSDEFKTRVINAQGELSPFTCKGGRRIRARHIILSTLTAEVPVFLVLPQKQALLLASVFTVCPMIIGNVLSHLCSLPLVVSDAEYH
jgi:hypothetical protein